MKKIILSLIFIFALTIALFSVSAGALEIISADIDIVLDENGDAFVTEVWNMNYEPGEKTKGFSRNIDIYYAGSDMPVIDKFGDVSDITVKVDGKEVVSAQGDNAFQFAEKKTDLGRKYYAVDINYPGMVDSRKYEISYKITDVVKKNGNDAVFSYMVIGKTLTENCNNIYVDVTFPDDVKESDIVIPEDCKGDGKVSGNTASYYVESVGLTFSVSASCSKDFFNASSLTRYSENSQGLNNFFAGLKKAFPFILALIAACVIVLFVLLPDRLVRVSLERKVRKELKTENGKKFTVPENKTACECYKLLNPSSRISPVSTAKRVPALFAMAVLECIERGYIVEDDEKLIVGTPRENVPAYITSVLNFLKSFSTQKGNRYIIDKDFAERVIAECEVKYDLITNYLSTFYTLIDGEKPGYFLKKENQDIYKSAYALKLSAENIKPKPTFAQCMNTVSAGLKTKDADVFAMMFGSVAPDKMFDKGSGKKGEKELCEAILAMYEVFIKSK